ncbi:MAG: SemiSWEET transporter [Candidatus Thermoplasmatota archaeon]|nr:SemiSWEET transporter [Candidatus Thermoplasmatota archaeon]
MDWTILGLLAGGITSAGFIPQLVRGFRTKRLNDVSYYMPLVLIVGMSLWLLYGIIREDLSIIVANFVGVSCNTLLITMKKIYQ